MASITTIALILGVKDMNTFWPVTYDELYLKSCIFLKRGVLLLFRLANPIDLHWNRDLCVVLVMWIQWSSRLMAVNIFISPSIGYIIIYVAACLNKSSSLHYFFDLVLLAQLNALFTLVINNPTTTITNN